MGFIAKLQSMNNGLNVKILVIFGSFIMEVLLQK